MKNFFKSNASYGITALRVMLGTVFMAHGAQKLFGIWGGYGLQGTAGFMSKIGLEPGYLMAVLAGGGEFIGGILLIIGLLSRLAAVNTLVIGIVALFSVHLANGFFMSKNGYEFILTLIIASIAIIVEGGGKCAVDGLISKEENKQQ